MGPTNLSTRQGEATLAEQTRPGIRVTEASARSFQLSAPPFPPAGTGKAHRAVSYEDGQTAAMTPSESCQCRLPFLLLGGCSPHLGEAFHSFPPLPLPAQEGGRTHHPAGPSFLPDACPPRLVPFPNRMAPQTRPHLPLCLLETSSQGVTEGTCSGPARWLRPSSGGAAPQESTQAPAEARPQNRAALTRKAAAAECKRQPAVFRVCFLYHVLHTTSGARHRHHPSSRTLSLVPTPAFPSRPLSAPPVQARKHRSVGASGALSPA